MNVKIKCGEEIRILRKAEPTFEELKQFVSSGFSELSARFRLYYIDAENEKIIVANDEDLKTMREGLREKQARVFVEECDDPAQDIEVQFQRLSIEKAVPQIQKRKTSKNKEKFNKMYEKIIANVLAKVEQKIEQKIEKPPEVKPPQVVHKGVTCNGCQASPIQGVRYKCSVCPNLDLCEECDTKQTHRHLMLVIRKPPVQPQPMQFDVARQKRIDLICEVAKIMPEAATLMCDMHPNYSVDELLDLITAQK